jgi:aldose 1-epimerase
VLKIEYKNQRLSINKKGAGIAQYFLVDKNNNQKNIIYGYRSSKEKDGSMGDILSPFPGRVEKAQYKYGDKKYYLTGTRLKDTNAIHGFVKDRVWSFKVGKNRIIGEYLLNGQEEAIGYPFKLLYQVSYQLGKDGLEVKTKVKNIGEKTAPFGIGFHPYFTLNCPVDDIYCQFEAEKVVEFDKNLKPTGKLIDIKKTDYDFSEGKNIDSLVIDNCFTKLARDEKGIFKIRLKNRNKNRLITIWQDQSFGYLQLYSADTKDKPLKRAALAVEPQTCTGYAFNVSKMGLIELKPGQEFFGSWGVLK